MLFRIFSTCAALSAFGFLTSVSRAAMATYSYDGTQTTFPGSSTDFTLFGNPATYPSEGTNGGGPGTQPTVLTDFSVGLNSSTVMYQGNSSYSTVIAPNGASTRTGIIFEGVSSQPDIATVTLGNTGFNYGDFNLYVMFGNGDANGTYETAITVTIGSTTYTAPVVDEASTAGNDYVQVEEFNIQGLSAGQSFTVGADAANGGVSYIGALSFESVPEPSTYALLAVGMMGGLIVLGRRRLQAR